ncbi:hypothetical protein L7F22_047175 [Adiantum nelumboides]|nr:hypothetical protein [Adiantum nelumboides]
MTDASSSSEMASSAASSVVNKMSKVTFTLTNKPLPTFEEEMKAWNMELDEWRKEKAAILKERDKRLMFSKRKSPLCETGCHAKKEKLLRSLSFSARSVTRASSADSSRSSSAACQSLNGVLLSLAAALAVTLAAPLDAEIASAATIKMRADEGSLVFVPSSISIPAGEKVIFLNNKGFPHNIIFEKNGVPEGVQVELISHDDYMNDQGQQFVVTLKEKGTYTFFCEPHRAAGMFGEITVT